MNELSEMKAKVEPDEILLLVDAMAGQDAVNVAKSFNEQLTLTGAVMSKLDGDARGGAALSIKYLTGIPIKFMATGEKVDDIEVAVKWLQDKGIETEPIRFDEYTQKRMTFFRDPDDLPLELHE